MGQLEGERALLSAGLGCAGLPWRGDSFPQACPSPSSLYLQLELSLEGRRHFLCPLPLISRHSWQAQKRQQEQGGGRPPTPTPLGSAQAWTWGKGAQWPRQAQWGRGSPVAFLPRGVRQAHGTHRGTAGRDRCTGRSGWAGALQAALTPMPGIPGLWLKSLPPSLLEAPPGQRCPVIDHEVPARHDTQRWGDSPALFTTALGPPRRWEVRSGSWVGDHRDRQAAPPASTPPPGAV